MALFSRRFWHAVIKLDGRVAAAAANYDSALLRLRTSREALTKEAGAEFHLDLCEAVSDLRTALHELNRFVDRNSTGLKDN